MKKFLLVLLTFAFYSAFSQSSVQMVNGWRLAGVGGYIDSQKTKTYLHQEGQVFSSYGLTDLVLKIPTMQTTWCKSIVDKTLMTPDTTMFEMKFFDGEGESNIQKVIVYLAVQYGDEKYYSMSGKIIPLSSSSWQSYAFDMSKVKAFGLNEITKMYLDFEFFTKDSCYVGGKVVIRNLKAVDRNGTYLIDFGTITKVKETEQNPKAFALEQNYPNPFNPSTTISFTIPRKEYVKLTVFNSLGQEVKTLVSEEKGPGSHEVRFDASGLPSGVYFYRLQAGNFVETKRMNFLK